ncbi:unnamed protein product [Nezara viridula]|uniref:RETREG1-3/ARL6IP-like N-terminal reticulon-homology domain-containing protein n=1 Tax=Nezara viridula TaxID=85310 RepID=A0A9P0HHG7_NEZVI|nr:unnamed protein product [Nezara viridula]
MIDGNPGFAIEREIHLKKVKRALDNWREVALLVNSLLLWKKKFYPWLIVSVSSFIFVEIAYYNPSFLTSVGLILMTATLIDYAGPSVTAMIWKHEDWSGAKEREFEDMCRAVAGFIVQLKQIWISAMEIKVSRPYLYFAITITTSFTLAVIGNSVNNIFILFILTTAILLLPGMIHFGILQRYYAAALCYLANLLRSFNSSTCKTKVQ